MKRRANKLSDYLKWSEGNKDSGKGKSERHAVRVTSNVRCHVSEQSEESNVKPTDMGESKLLESESCKKENYKNQMDHIPPPTYVSNVKKCKSEKVRCDQPEEGHFSDTIPEQTNASEVSSNPLMNNKSHNYASAVKGKYIHSE